MTQFGQTQSSMNKKEHTIKVSDSFSKTDKKCDYEISFRKWLVQEIEEGEITPTEAIKQFNFHPINGIKMIRDWREKYANQIVVSLPEMTAEEKQLLAALQKRNKELEKALEDAKMKHIALDILIDVAEEKLKINIRKKPGAK